MVEKEDDDDEVLLLLFLPTREASTVNARRGFGVPDP
jgi:hypothetical protein